MTPVARVRADELVVRQGLAASRSRAKVLILAGEVRTPDRLVSKPSEPLPVDTELQLKEKPRFVSRGGAKLEAALAAFEVPVEHAIAADIGASTGGFTDCLLQAGAAKVYAVDVGYGQLDYSLREDDRVVVLERINARYMEPLPEPVDLMTIDVSFIAIRLILENLVRSLRGGGRVVALIKPQFEAGREAVGRQGVVRDERIRERAVRDVVRFAGEIGLGFDGLIRSPLVGPAGNEEFLVSLIEGAPTDDRAVERAIQQVFSR